VSGVEKVLSGLVNELVSAVEQREAGEPDMPAWEAQRRVRQAEEALVTFYRAYVGAPDDEGVGKAPVQTKSASRPIATGVR
jgi:hypothetical protein